MAVTKIWPVKGRLDKPIDYVMNKDKTENPKFSEKNIQALDDVIQYAANEDKTEMRMYVSALNCNTLCARRQFITVKKRYGKEDGILAFHGYQSFAPGETTPDEAHEIGVKLAEELWGDRFQVIVATHLNTQCLHNHFLLNSVSYVDGKKFYASKATYKHMQEVSDRLCREYGLSVVENKEKGGEPVHMSQKSAEGMPTRYNMTRDAIDEAIKSSRSMYEFEKRLKSLGYQTQFNPKRKYWTVTPKGWERPIRLARLGEEYTNERIYERIHEQKVYIPFETFQKRTYKQYKFPTRKDWIFKVKGVKGTYLKYCYLLGYLPKYNQNPNRVHYLLRDELLNCEKYSKQIRLMSKYNLTTKEEVVNFVEGRKEEMNALIEERDELRKEIRRVLPEEVIEKKKGEITLLTAKLKELRDEVRLAEDIPERSEKMEEKMEAIEKDEKKKEVRKR